MAAGRIKMLFSDAPPDALEKLLSPKRKLFYGLFAFGPGTVLGLYLYSVQRRMERENEALRLEHVKTELGVVQNQQDKDEALANAIQEMRDRLRRLEEEANVSREKAAKVASASAVDSKAAKKEMPVEAQAATDSKIEAALAVLKSKEQPDEQKKEAASPAWMTSSLDGSQGRRDKRHKDMLQEDIAAYIAKKTK